MTRARILDLLICALAGIMVGTFWRALLIPAGVDPQAASISGTVVAVGLSAAWNRRQADLRDKAERTPE